jgi:superfamily II DNA or RNA helicase
MNLVPLPHQRDLARYLLHPETRRFVALWMMGTGKTPLAIIFCETNLFYRYPGQTIIPQLCIIVADPTIQKNFISNLQKFGKSQEHIEKFYRFWSYQLVATRPKEFAEISRNNIVVCDEIHEIRSVITTVQDKETAVDNKETDDTTNQIRFQNKPVRSGMQAAALLSGIQYAYKALGLTGTLIYNSLSDLYNIAWFLLSASSEETKQQFQENVKVTALKQNVMPEKSIEAFETVFKGKLSVCTIQSCGLQSQFPIAHELNVAIEMNAEYDHAYSLVETGQIEELKKKNETKLAGSGAFWSGLRQAANKINSVQSQKLQFVIEIIKAAKRRKERVVVTSSFLTRGLGLLIKEFPKHGIRFEEISGDIHSSVERQNSIDRFNDPSTALDVLILSGAGTTGVNLTCARRQINMESAWNTATKHQTNARIARLGSKMRQVTIYNLLMVKPGEPFRRFIAECKQMIRDKIPGTPTDVVAVPALSSLPSSSSSSTEKGLDMSIDVHLFQLQIKKSIAFQPCLEKYLPKWSMEQHPAWKEILSTCPSIDAFLSIRPKSSIDRKQSEVKDTPKTKGEVKDTHKTKTNGKVKQLEKKRTQLRSAWERDFGIISRLNDKKKSSSSSSSSSCSSFSSASSTSSDHALHFDTKGWLSQLGL